MRRECSTRINRVAHRKDFSLSNLPIVFFFLLLVTINILFVDRSYACYLVELHSIGTMSQVMSEKESGRSAKERGKVRVSPGPSKDDHSEVEEARKERASSLMSKEKPDPNPKMKKCSLSHGSKRKMELIRWRPIDLALK